MDNQTVRDRILDLPGNKIDNMFLSVVNISDALNVTRKVVRTVVADLLDEQFLEFRFGLNLEVGTEEFDTEYLMKTGKKEQLKRTNFR